MKDLYSPKFPRVLRKPGVKNVLMCPLGSLGPGITPKIIVHLLLKCSLLGKFSTVIMIAET